MEIAVCVKPVPDPEKYNELTIDPETKRLNREGIPTVINPSDKNALEEALKIKESHGGSITVISMTPLFSKKNVVECLAMGADEAFILSDRAFGGADTYATSYTLAQGLAKTGKKFDLILAGNESADGATSHVPSQLGEWLRLPHIANVQQIEVNGDRAGVHKKIAGGFIEYEVKLPAVFAVARSANQPRLINAIGIIKARKKPLTVFTREDLQADADKIGLGGSPTRAGELLTPDMSRKAEELKGSPQEIAESIIAILRKSGIEF
ncbi:MAG: electron transfer flavoprotein subunit beta/FixA family protein [Anaerovoracaceae bacterium]